MSRLQAPKCAEHPSRSVEFYCEYCSDVACTSCVLSSRHRGHSSEIIDINIAIDDRQARIGDCISRANGYLQGAEDAMDDLARCVGELKLNQSKAERRIELYFHRMRSILVDREHYFKGLLKQKVDERIKFISGKRQQSKEALDGIITGLKSLDNISNNPSDITSLINEASVTRLLKNHFETIDNQPSTSEIEVDRSVTMPCFEDSNFEKVCRRVGDPDYRVCSNNSISCNSHHPKPMPRLNASRESPTAPLKLPANPPKRLRTKTAPYSIDNDDGNDVPPPIPPKSPKSPKNHLPQWLHDYKKQYDAEKSKDVHQPSPIASKTPTKPEIIQSGQVIIELELPTPDSPHAKTLHAFTEVPSRMMRGPAERKEDVIKPYDICTGLNNVLIVTDVAASTVRILKGSGKFLDYIGKGSTIDGITEPTTVTTDADGNIFIGDQASLNVYKFTSLGKFICKVLKNPLNHIDDIHGLIITYNNHILISDWTKCCIHIFDLSGRYVKKFRPPEAASFQPTGLAIDNRGRLIVADKSSDRIWIFTPDGELLNHFGWPGDKPGDLKSPHGVAVNHKGKIIVSESGNNRLSIFTDVGDFVKCVGEKGCDVGQFESPKSICITSTGTLVVTDEGNTRLQFFDNI
jgi:hypothetical protein